MSEHEWVAQSKPFFGRVLVCKNCGAMFVNPDAIRSSYIPPCPIL